MALHADLGKDEVARIAPRSLRLEKAWGARFPVGLQLPVEISFARCGQVIHFGYKT